MPTTTRGFGLLSPSPDPVGFQRLLFVAVYAVFLAGILISALYFLSSLPFHRPLDPVTDPDASSSTPTQDGSRKVFDAWRGDVFKPPPIEKGMPPLSEFKLRKELIASRVRDNIVFVTFGNYAFRDLIENWARHLIGLNLHNFIVGALDTKLLEALYWKGIPVFDMGSGTKVGDLHWGSKDFHRMGRDKIYLLSTLLPFGFEVLMSDTDTVWLKNPLPYLAQFPEADVLVSTDSMELSSTDDYLDKWTDIFASYNIGIFHWRPTKIAVKFAKEWHELLIADDKLWDQAAFNHMMRGNLGPSAEGEDGLVYAYNKSLKLGILPASIFCNGHTYFVQKMPQQLHLEAYVVHATFQFGGSAGKRHRLREALLFYDPPEYFDSPGGFLTFKPRIPRRLLVEGKANLERHFSLVNYQLKQIRTALAIASLLNRTLVMPPLWCRFDSLWFRHPGIIPHSLTTSPFLCPMDHVLEPEAMLKKHSRDLFGPRIEFREYSFLENPSLPKEIKESLLHVQFCEEHSAGCNMTAPGLLRLPMNRDEDTFVRIFSSYKDVKVLEFSSMVGTFEGFTDKEREKRFRRRVSRYTGLWCCLENLKVSPIFYDMFWDEKPGWKPLPPLTKEDNHPKWVD